MHGTILTIFSLYLCMSKREKGSFAAKFADVRFIFLMMGLFSTYCGVIYNDFSSLPVMIGDSCWTEPKEEEL
jgi:vacuolar-type H+-ATPase subunit I/STV1